MNKTHYIIIILSLLCLNTKAQEQTHKRHIYSLGLNTYGPYGSDMGLEAFYDVRLNGWLSLGGLGEVDINPKVIDKKIDLFVGGRFNFHIFKQMKEERTHWDPYIGITEGMRINPWIKDYTEHHDFYVGARYFIKEHWAVFIEVGTSDALGISLAI